MTFLSDLKVFNMTLQSGPFCFSHLEAHIIIRLVEMAMYIASYNRLKGQLPAYPEPLTKGGGS